MITKYDIFWHTLTYEDRTGGKARPIIIFDEEETEKIFEIVGVYSYQKWFKQDNRFYKIVDWKQVGLEKESYVKLSAIEAINKSQIDENEKIGHLSDNDIVGLSTAIEQYYS
jgi:hypothetical protein